MVGEGFSEKAACEEDPKEVRGRAVQMSREGAPPSGRNKRKDPDASVSLLFEEQQGFQWGWSRDH